MGQGNFQTPNSHVDGEDSAKTMVYNMKKEFTERKDEKKKRQKKEEKCRRNTTVKRKNSKLLITLFGHDRGCFSALLYVPL